MTINLNEKAEAHEFDAALEVRRWEAGRLIDEFEWLGLQPPRGLASALASYISGSVTTDQIQQYLDIHLSQPMSMEDHHA